MLRAPPRPTEPPGSDDAPSPRSAPPQARAFVSPERSRRALLIAAGVAVLIVGVLALAFGPLARARIAAEADRRQLDVDVGSIRPGFFAVTLADVRVRPRGVRGLEATLEAVRVDLSASFSVADVQVSGGAVVVVGEPEDVARRLRDLRGAQVKGDGASARGSKAPLRADGLSLTWKIPSGGELSGRGIALARDGAATRLRCGACSAHLKDLAIEATGAEIELSSDGAPRRLEATSLVVAQLSSTAPEVAASAAVSAAEPAPPPLPIVTKRAARGGKSAPAARAARGGKSVPAAAPAPPSGPVLPLPDLHALRARIGAAVAAFVPRFPEDASVEIGGLTVKLDVGGEPMAFGPGKLTLTRTGERVRLGFASADTRADASHEALRGQTPISIDADLPVGRGEISARLAGGPVSLAALGVEEGTKGLTDLAHGTVAGKGQITLSDAADALTFDGSLSLKGISLKQPRLALETLRGIDFTVSAHGLLDDRGRLRVDDGQVDMGALHVRTHGTLEETTDHFAVALALDVAPAACQSLIDSAPQGLLPLVRSARMTGTFASSLSLAFDTRTIDKLALDYRVGDECRMVEVPRELARERFEGAFTYRTYKPDGTIGETTTGPGSRSWTALDDISPFMVAAVLTTEDGAFYKHRGFNHAAIRSSVQANLKARRFVRGASTITMQLAKNLFLARDKALSRKVEEVILTDYLEQIFRKDDMMELYLNVVEFGPDVYGITQAAEYYFARRPDELNVAEAFFLATLLPSPIRYGRLRDRGQVPDAWMAHLRTLMEIAARNGKLSNVELEEGLKETIVFVRPGEPRPEPRKPLTARHRDQADDDDAWRPLE
jgi:hypothetical protein